MPLVSVVNIVEDDRQRKTYERIEELADSIGKYGLVQPIVVEPDGDGNYMLIAGGRRLRAVRILQWEKVDVFFKEDLTYAQRRRLELEENLHRQDLTPVEEVDALAELHRLEQEEHGSRAQGRRPEVGFGSEKGEGWSITDTADLLGVDKSTVSRDLKLAHELAELKEMSPALYKLVTKDGKASSKSGMMKDASRFIQRGIREQSAAERIKERPDLANMVRYGDSRDLIKELPDGCVDVVLTDPPFGVLEDSLRDTISSTRSSGGLSYEDAPELILQIISDLAPELYRVMAPNSHLYMFTTLGAKDPLHPEKYASFQNIAFQLAKAGFSVRPGPIMWIKEMKYGYTLDPMSQFPYCYECVVFARKGSRAFNVKADLDYIIHPPQSRDREHIAQKPITLWYHLLKYSYVPRGLMLDCFCGSGGSLLQGVRMGMNVVGFDKDPNCVALTTDRLAEELEAQRVIQERVKEVELERLAAEMKSE